LVKLIQDEEPITCRPADLLEPEYEKMKAQAEKLGLIKKEEDVLTYILYPAIAPAFLRGESKEEELTPIMTEMHPCAVSSSQGIPTEFKVEVDGDVFNVKVHPVDGSLTVTESSGKPSARSVAGAVTSHMQGMVLSIKVGVGDDVKEGDIICVMEAMKMENAIHAPHSGIVKEIFFGEGDPVASGDILMAIE